MKVRIEARLPQEERPVHKMINERFKRVGDRIAVTHTRVFAQHPSAILELFLLMGQLNIRHIRTRTLRVLKNCSARGIGCPFSLRPCQQVIVHGQYQGTKLAILAAAGDETLRGAWYSFTSLWANYGTDAI